MTTKGIYKQPDYSKAQQSAYDTLKESSIISFPVDLRKIVSTYDNLSLMKYTCVAKKTNVSVRELAILLQSEEGCLYRDGKGKYIIFYNDTVDYNPRVRFTIAHEIGHYVMNHLGSKETIIARQALQKIQEKHKEQEANYFAKRLLAPIPAIDLYLKAWNKITVSLIHELFDTSLQVSKYIVTDLHRRHQNTRGVVWESHPLQEQFESYVQSQAYSKICQRCESVNWFSGISKYCSICNSTNLKKVDADTFLSIIRPGVWTMKYSAINVNKNSIALECPICSNEEIEEHEELCLICGTYIRNICTGLEEPTNPEWEVPPKDLEGCQTNLKGNARYCVQCGALSSFYYYGILQHWKIEFESNAEKLPFE